MDAEDFVSKMASLAPSKNHLLDCGYDDEQADSYIACYVCAPRPKPLLPSMLGDPFFVLFNGWDLSSLEIGSLTFHAKFQLFPHHLEIGTLGGDRLVCRTECRDFALLDWQNLQHVLYRISTDSSSFLAGLLTVAECLSKHSVEEINLDDDVAIANEWTLKCAAAFGGADAEPFCRHLLGTDEISP